jgi:non-specific serine/threonine protein kinase
MQVIHANWSGGKLRVWAESAARWAKRGAPEDRAHPFAASLEELRGAIGLPEREGGELDVMLPEEGEAGAPGPSVRMAHAVGHAASEDAVATKPRLRAYRVPALVVAPGQASEFLSALEDRFAGSENGVLLGPTVEFLLGAARLGRHLVAQQRFVPALRQQSTGDLHGLWQAWVGDEKTAQRVAMLMASMPPAARAAVDEYDHKPWPMLESFLSAVVDAECRRTLIHENMVDAIEGRDAAADAQVAWLAGLLGQGDDVSTQGAARTNMVKQVRRWISGLEDRGTSSSWRLLIRLSEPADAALLTDMEEPGDSVMWPLTFHLQSQENPRLVVDASDVWLLATDAITVEGRRLESPQELLLAELGRAARVYPHLEKALREAEPATMELNTKQAYQFLREQRPVLLEQGFGVQAPEWWDQPSARLGARLKLTSDALEVVLGESGQSPVTAAGSRLGLASLVNYTWDIAIGGTTLSLAEFEKLAGKRTPLVRINGRWVEVRPEDVRAAMKFIQDNPGGVMRVGDAIRLAYGADSRTSGVPIVGMEATGWVGAFFGEGMQQEQLPLVEPPKAFHGSLRPYQVRGISWMAFLERFGFGPCLADDMGLGKTIQLLALLAYERQQRAEMLAKQDAAGAAPDAANGAPATEEGAADAAAVAAASGRTPPTLLVVPMSVVGNWIHEAKRFCPELRVLLHHGIGRYTTDEFVKQAESSDAVITTYAIAHRDRETLRRVHWQRVVLDEAQYIKNPGTKQSAAVRSLPSNTRGR